MTTDDQIDLFLRSWTFPNSNRRAAKVALFRIIEEAVQTALAQAGQRRRASVPAKVVKEGGLREISYNFDDGPGG